MKMVKENVYKIRKNPEISGILEKWLVCYRGTKRLFCGAMDLYRGLIYKAT